MADPNLTGEGDEVLQVVGGLGLQQAEVPQVRWLAWQR